MYVDGVPAKNSATQRRATIAREWCLRRNRPHHSSRQIRKPGIRIRKSERTLTKTSGKPERSGQEPGLISLLGAAAPRAGTACGCNGSVATANLAIHSTALPEGLGSPRLFAINHPGDAV